MDSLSIGTDIAGNVVSSTPSSGASFNVDNTAPTMTITSSQVLDGYTSDNSSIILTFNSSESTTNFGVGDITVSNGSVTSFSGSGVNYSATFTPTGNGSCTIDVNAGAFTDDAETIIFT